MRWLFALLLLTEAAFAQSQQAPATQEAPKTKASPAQEQHGTKDNPLTVNVVPTTEQKADAEKKDVEAKLKVTDDKRIIEYTGYQVLIGIVTFAIFVLQLVAFVAQACYMRRSNTEMRRGTYATVRAARAAQKSADAAQATAAALPIVEGAYVYPSIINVNISEKFTAFGKNSKLGSQSLFVEYEFKNFGKTPAIIHSIAANLVHIDPRKTFWVGEARVPFERAIIGANEGTGRTTVNIADFSKGEWGDRQKRQNASQLFRKRLLL